MVKLVNQMLFSQKIKEKKLYIFSTNDIRALFGVSAVAAVALLHRYIKQGFVLKLKRKQYILSDTQPPDVYIASKLYAPSYISLEFALSYHGVIPETVYEVTSITTRSTRRFKALGRVFSYRKIKRSAYTGYEAQKINNLSFYIASAEKALVDLIYLRSKNKQRQISRIDKNKINLSKALKYATLFESEKLTMTVKKTLL